MVNSRYLAIRYVWLILINGFFVSLMFFTDLKLLREQKLSSEIDYASLSMQVSAFPAIKNGFIMLSHLIGLLRPVTQSTI